MKRIVGSGFSLIGVAGIALLALIALDVQGPHSPLAAVRLLLGLAFGLSIAAVPPIALILDKLPWGLRLWPIVTALALFILVCSTVAIARRQRLPDEERFMLVVEMDVKGWWAAQDRTGRILYGVLALALLTAAASATAIVVLPKPGERFTEFYLLGPEGLAENYPRQAVVGQPVTVTVGIANQEGVPAGYRVEVRNGDHLIGQAGPVQLNSGGTTEMPVTFTPVDVGDDVKVTFLLYRDGGAQPYRSLRLWLKVNEEETSR